LKRNTTKSHAASVANHNGNMNSETDTPAAPPEQPKSAVDLTIDRLNKEITDRYKMIHFIASHREAFEQCGADPVSFGDWIDFNNPTRPQILEIIKAFPGKWEKSLNSADRKSMDYIRRVEGEPTMRIWGGELPPCCKLVEVEVDVPAVPAHKAKVQRVVCPEPLQEVAP